MKKPTLLYGLLMCHSCLIAQTTLISYGSSWKYLDNGSNQGTAWRAISFSDGTWRTGNAELGYGDGDEKTVVRYGSSSSLKYVTTYFRKSISIANASLYSGLSLSIKRDDGAVVYINGTQVYRTNMPSGTISYSTLASADASDDGKTAQIVSLSSALLVNGTNVIAIEIHQRTRSSSDISFDLQLTATGGSDITPPAVSTYSPADNATNVATNSNLVLTFNETVQKGSGSIVIKQGGVATQTISVIDAAVTVSGNTATINPADFNYGSAVNIEIAAGTFKDVSNNNYAGITNATTWNFNTITAPGAAVLTRGPYLNMGNETAVSLRWRTDVATNSKVELGTSYGTYSIVTNNSSVVTEHEVRVTGLNADTKYYYRFGSSTQILQQGSDNYFITAPPSTTTRKLRIAAFGDCGRNDNTYQSGTLTSYRNYTASNPGEALMLLGDNAYESGTDAEFQTRFFDIYSSNILKNHILFPSPGNHDYANNSTRQADHNIPYYSAFTLPAAGECGGVASGTEAYFSWNWGNVHFLSLDSYGKENSGTTRLYDTTGAQVTWIKSDLNANTRPWVIAYWHHPPFTMGSHNSDTETELVNMRQNFIRILERYGVDLVICGHSHDYERSYLLKNYFGTEATFNAATHAVSTSSAKYNGTTNSCPYIVAPGKVNHGTVYVVAGSAGASGGTQSGYPHNALPWSFNDGGMLYLEVEGNRLDAKFIRRTGVVSDQFTILKDAGRTTNLTINAGSSTQLTASWIGNYAWNTGATTRSITVAPASNTTYTVNDGSGCVSDVFNITINSGQKMLTKAPGIKEQQTSFSLIPSFVKRGRVIRVKATNEDFREAAVVDINGRIMKTHRFSGSFNIATNELQKGIYFLRITDGDLKVYVQRFAVTD